MSLPADVLDQIEVGVLIQDVHSNILYANQAARDLLGLDEPELLSRSSLDPSWLVVDADGTPIAGEDVPVPVSIRTREPVRGAVLGVWRPRSEERVWLLVNALPQLDENGEVRHVVCTISNISREQLAQQELRALNESLAQAVEARTAELSRTVQALRESEASYRSVIRAMAEGVAVHDRQGNIVDANPAAQAILGLSLEQLRGEAAVSPIWRLTREDGSPLPEEEIPSEITRLTGQPCRNHILQVRRANGEIAWLSVNTDPMQTEGERAPFRVVATFTDITRERDALEEVEESRDRFHRITEAVPGLILENLVAPDGEESFPFASSRAWEVLGVSASEIMADPEAFWGCLAREDRVRIREARDAAIQEGTTLDQEFRLRGSGPDPRWVRIRAGVPASTPDGHLLHCILLEVTEQRRMAKALYDSQRQEGLGILAAGIAHNFNNMLAAIVPSLELAVEEAGEELRPAMEDAHEAALGASELVQRLLILAGRRTEVEPEPVDLAELAEDVVRVCRRTFDRKVEFQVDRPEAGRAVVVARPAELQQVILNLCINARDAMEGTSLPLLQVRVTAGAEEVVLQVEDNGEGMDQETQDRLGEPFFTTKPVGHGTGLGLASCLAVVRKLGGQMEWSSVPGQGAVFTVRLPRAERAVAAPSGGRDGGGDGAVRGAVLVVDDEPLVRKTVRRMLARAGTEVAEAPSGQAALEWIREGNRPDLILLDLSMPGLSGRETLALLKAEAPAVPVLIMSGHIPDGDGLESADGVLQKPMGSRDLLAAVRTVLDGGRGEG